MNATDQLVQRMLDRTITEDEFDKLSDIAIYIERHIFCPVSTKLMDVRRAKLAYITDPQGEDQKVALHEEINDEALGIVLESRGMILQHTWKPTPELVKRAWS